MKKRKNGWENKNNAIKQGKTIKKQVSKTKPKKERRRMSV